MKSKNLITKVALGIAIAALIFSIVTLVRSIVTGKNILMSCIIVVGTMIVVAICAIMLYILNKYEPDEDAEDDTDESDNTAEPDEEQADAEAPAEAESEPLDAPVDQEDIEAQVDELIANLESEKPYDLSNFE